MKRRLLILVVAALSWACARGDGEGGLRPGPASDDIARLDAIWIPVEGVSDGRVLPPEELRNTIRVVQDGRYIIRIMNERGMPRLIPDEVWDIDLDPERTPKAISRTLRGPEPREKVEGIYRLEGDTLTECVGPTRPTEFAAPAGSGRSLMIYRRYGTPPAPGADVELARLAGTWAAVEGFHSGSPLAPEVLRRRRLVIEGDRYLVGSVDGDESPRDGDAIGQMVIDPTRVPKAFELIWVSGVIGGRWRHEGIYRLEGDTLTECVGPTRPTEFAAPAGSGRSLFIYKRMAKEERANKQAEPGQNKPPR